MFRLSILLALPILLSCAAEAGKPVPAKSASPATVDWRAVWLSLDRTENRCDSYDYHPTGGMRMFYCHLLSQVDLTRLQASAGMPIFLSGPHEQGLNLDTPSSFGHYNPEFVRWAGQALVPGADDAEFRQLTQPLYDSAVAPLARIHHQTWQKLQSDPDCAARELTAYLAAIKASSRDYYERWFFFMNPRFCEPGTNQEVFFEDGFDGGVSGNVVKTTVGFWLRRSVDGTADAFHAALVRLLETYDASWLSAHSGRG